MAGIKLRPLIILSPAGEILDVAQMNEKGYRKTLEAGSLWVVHPQTGRLLPYEPSGELLRLADRQRWYEGVIAGARSGQEAGRTSASPGKGEGVAGTSPSSPPPAGTAVLSQLAEVIRQRKSKLPEGSYTAYLFKEGSAKIRKKLGEEAVELILARDKGEIAFESADLLYHLLVLLEDSGVNLAQVLTELASRAQ